MAIKHVMVAVGTFSKSIFPAKYAVVLARQLNARLTAVHVINQKVLQDLLRSRVFVEAEARQYERDLEDQGRVLMERIKKIAQAKGVDCQTIVLRGEISAEVAAKSQELEVDILVMGELKELLSATEVFYDEGERLFRKVACPVLVVKDPEYVETLYKEL